MPQPTGASAFILVSSEPHIPRRVNISGKFSGGEIKAKKIYINGEFSGKLEGDEIEIGPGASGSGELIYRESISISKGSRVEGQISRVTEELKLVKSPPEPSMVDINLPAEKINLPPEKTISSAEKISEAR